MYFLLQWKDILNYISGIKLSGVWSYQLEGTGKEQDGEVLLCAVQIGSIWWLLCVWSKFGLIGGYKLNWACTLEGGNSLEETNK